jgi:hypothetical protein
MFAAACPPFMKPLQLVAAGSLLALTTSCATTLQSSVRSAGLGCSESRAYWITDVVLAGTWAALASYGELGPTAYVPTGVLLASALYGGYKRGRCVEYRAKATPEMWAAYSPAPAAYVPAPETGGTVESWEPPPVETYEESTYAPIESSSYEQPPPQRVQIRIGGTSSGGSNTLTINGCTYTDQPGGALGQPCSSGGCPSSYTCDVVVGDRGQCVPEAQRSACK